MNDTENALDRLKQTMANRYSFVGLYLALMVPTYVLPYFGSNSLLVNIIAAGAGVTLLLLLHIACLGALCVLARYRGMHISKTWIVTFPVIAAVFDIVPGLSLIPLVPTVMHVCALIIGASGEDPANPDTFS